jgi:glycerophosphoryl diester phosphodiesterase
MNPLIYAHRGASGDAPENTMAAFRLALEQGAEGIELDVQLTADGKLVVIHDETLDRTTTGRGPVADHPYDRIRRYDASYGFDAYSGEPVPLLSEVLDLLQPASLELNIELKNGILPNEGMEEAAVRMVREYGMERQVVFSSFNHYSVVKLLRLAPEIETAILYDAHLYRPWDYAAGLGAGALHPWFHSVDAGIVTGAHEAGLKLRPFTVNGDADFIRMMESGVDAVITNYPAKLKALRDSRRRTF